MCSGIVFYYGCCQFCSPSTSAEAVQQVHQLPLVAATDVFAYCMGMNRSSASDLQMLDTVVGCLKIISICAVMEHWRQHVVRYILLTDQ
jgi:hypothetical protein